MLVSGVARQPEARSQNFVRKLLMMMGYSEGLFLLFEFYSQNRRGWPDMPVTFVIRYAHPTGRLAGAQQKTLCLCKEK